MLLSAVLSVVASTAIVSAQVTSDPCVTQPGLPDCCIGSYPNITACVQDNWYLGSLVDECMPLSLNNGVVSGQYVYIKDETQNNYYNKGLYPTIVDAEGYVQSFCMGDYLPPGSLKLPDGGILFAHVLKNFTVTGQNYYQIHGALDCDVLHVNCTASSPDAYDDGGQYDSGPFISCGKEPYSGVDATASGNLGFQDYVEMAGDGQFCQRVCEPGNREVGLPCDVTHDTEGCTRFMGVSFDDASWTYTDASNPSVVSSESVSLPPTTTTTTVPPTTSTVTTVNSAGTGVAGSTATTATKSGVEGRGVGVFILLISYLFF
ncbi:hypothetical protein HK100_000862 [Physocladia obscura]|uniref:Uncharacterized protein n=1 Tax=Physocladia obscura TaxID=109957 RepID=A0AAD5XFA6_9FUNG|nr:hypothetical protein HK100_000862 [Physocladia obscura]